MHGGFLTMISVSRTVSFSRMSRTSKALPIVFQPEVQIREVSSWWKLHSWGTFYSIQGRDSIARRRRMYVFMKVWRVRALSALRDLITISYMQPWMRTYCRRMAKGLEYVFCHVLREIGCCLLANTNSSNCDEFLFDCWRNRIIWPYWKKVSRWIRYIIQPKVQIPRLQYKFSEPLRFLHRSCSTSSVVLYHKPFMV